jgi:hypothetical protein
MTTPMTALPPVAKSFFAFCKKCDADRYHTVLAHTTAKSAKLKCEVCASVKSWSLPKAGTASASGAGKAGGGTRRMVSEAARQSAHKTKHEELLQSSVAGANENYSIKLKFQINQKLVHPKFGIGVVTAVFNDKVEVHFSDESRALVHNRS